MSIRRSAALVAVVLAGSCSIGLWSSPSRAEQTDPSGLSVLASSASPVLPAGSVSLGPLESSTALNIDVTLKVPDQGTVSSYIASLSDRRSPNFRHFLAPGEFGRLFGPPLSEVNAVRAVLKSDGLAPGPVSSNHLMIPVRATALALERAFHLGLSRYRLPGAESFSPRRRRRVSPRA